MKLFKAKGVLLIRLFKNSINCILRREWNEMRNFKGEVRMKLNVNLGSFILSLFCIPIFFMAIFSTNVFRFFTKFIGIHPLNIVLSITVIAFFLGFIGLKDVSEWKSMARSIFTITFTMGLSVVLVSILFIGKLLG